MNLINSRLAANINKYWKQLPVVFKLRSPFLLCIILLWQWSFETCKKIDTVKHLLSVEKYIELIDEKIQIILKSNLIFRWSLNEYYHWFCGSPAKSVFCKIISRVIFVLLLEQCLSPHISQHWLSIQIALGYKKDYCTEYSVLSSENRRSSEDNIIFIFSSFAIITNYLLLVLLTINNWVMV